MKKIVLIISLGIFIFLGVKFNNYYQVHKDIVEIENSALNKYISLYYIKNGAIPMNLNDLLQFVKERDVLLFEKLEDLEIHYIGEGHSYKLYHNGFDGKKDSLLKEYRINDIGFFKSIYIQGDILLNNHLRHHFEKKANTIYKVGENDLVEFDEINIIELYKQNLGCDKIYSEGAIHHKFQVEVRIANNMVFFDSSAFSETTKVILLNKLESKRKELDKDDVYVMDLLACNIELFECVD